jgi:hypothetical protein
LGIKLQTTSCLISPWRKQKLGPKLGFHIVCILARYRLEALSTLNKNSIFRWKNAKILSPILSLRPKFDRGFKHNSDLQTCNPKSWVQILKQSQLQVWKIILLLLLTIYKCRNLSTHSCNENPINSRNLIKEKKRGRMRQAASLSLGDGGVTPFQPFTHIITHHVLMQNILGFTQIQFSLSLSLSLSLGSGIPNLCSDASITDVSTLRLNSSSPKVLKKAWHNSRS